MSSFLHRSTVSVLARLAHASARTREGLAEAERVLRFTRGRLEFRPRDDDLWIVSYPRSGTTWMQYLVHLRLGRCDDFAHIDDVCPWFERGLSIGARTSDDLARLPGPRVFKSHLLPQWTPRVGRFVYLRRDPAEVVDSYYALYRDYLGHRGSRLEFARRVFAGDVQYGSWLTHVEAWQRAAEHRVLHVDYADLRRDPIAVMHAVSRHFDLPPDDAADARPCAGARLERMRAQQAKFDHAGLLLRERGIAAGNFVRHGCRRELDPDLAALVESARERARPTTPLRLFLR